MITFQAHNNFMEMLFLSVFMYEDKTQRAEGMSTDPGQETRWSLTLEPCPSHSPIQLSAALPRSCPIQMRRQ